jgi:DNA-binding NarL/FixJ family response regulator
VTKRCSEEEIENAIRFSMEGQRFYCSSVLETLKLPGLGKSEIVNTLSRREKEVLKLVLEGKTSGQIAEELFVSVHTVNSHRKNILKKFQLKSPAELLIYAIEHDVHKFLQV